MRRIVALWFAGAICISFLASSLLAEEGSVPYFTADENKANQRVWETLQKPLPQNTLEFVQTPLEEIVAVLRDEYEIEILLDKGALADMGIDPAKPIDAMLRNISLQAALKIILEEHELTYLVANEALIITTQEEADSHLAVCVYPVRDLVDTSYRPTETERKLGIPSELIPISKTLITTIASDTWAANGGGESSISGIRPGLLVVSQTQAVHDEIRATLSALRRAKQFAEQNQPVAEDGMMGEEGGFYGGFGGRGEFGGRGGFGGEGGFSGESGFGGGFGREAPREKKENADNPFAE